VVVYAYAVAAVCRDVWARRSIRDILDPA